MKYCLLLSLLLFGCANTKLVIVRPKVFVNIKGNVDDDEVVNINGAAVTVRVKWDIVKK